ncbi:MAG: hypothetical protein WCJ25_05645 [Candidatus Moraniibacteriota bacterium]
MEQIEEFVGSYPFLLIPETQDALVSLLAKKGQNYRTPVAVDTSENTERLARESGNGKTVAEDIAKVGAEAKIDKVRKVRGARGPIACVMCVVAFSDGSVLTTDMHGRVESGPKDVRDAKQLSIWTSPNLSGKPASLYLCVCVSEGKGQETKFTRVEVKRIDFRFRIMSDLFLKEILKKGFSLPRANPYSTFILELTDDPKSMEQFLISMTLDAYDELLPDIGDAWKERIMTHREDSVTA